MAPVLLTLIYLHNLNNSPFSPSLNTPPLNAAYMPRGASDGFNNTNIGIMTPDDDALDKHQPSPEGWTSKTFFLSSFISVVDALVRPFNGLTRAKQ